MKKIIGYFILSAITAFGIVVLGYAIYTDVWSFIAPLLCVYLLLGLVVLGLYLIGKN